MMSATLSRSSMRAAPCATLPRSSTRTPPRLQSLKARPICHVRPRVAGCRSLRVMARASADDSSRPEPLAMAPAELRTPYGEYLGNMLSMEPQLFQSAIEDQLSNLKNLQEVKEQAKMLSTNADSGELVLYRRMDEMWANETSAKLEDVMYLCIIDKFLQRDVEMLSPLESTVDAPLANLKGLTEGIHSKEALDLVREHMLSIMGTASHPQFSNAVMKISKLQMAQVYTASIMFGYFIRRVDTRFQLERSLGTLPPSREEAVLRLERMFSEAETQEDPLHEAVDVSDVSPTTVSASSTGPSESVDPTASSTDTTFASSASPSPSSPESFESSGSGMPAVREKSALRRYVESFDQEAILNTARMVSAEGAALVERQTTALMGDISKLQVQMQEAVGSQAISLEDLFQRMAKAVEQDAVETLTMSVGTQKRAILEAVAYGAFLRDVESWVQADYGLLSTRVYPRLPPGGSGAGGEPGHGGAGPAGGGWKGGALA